MGEAATLVLLGGCISLISALAGIALQHWFDLRKQEHETRRYPTEVLYNKQTEFYDRIVNLLPKVNGYITTVDVWLGETSPDAKRKAKQYAEKTGPIGKFNELLETYSAYLPEKVLRTGNELFTECLFLSNSPNMDKTEHCINLLFSFQNTLRECVGTDRISVDLLKAFSMSGREKGRKELEE